MATAHYKQPWVLRSNPEFLMCNWKPPQMINNGPIKRRVFQTPRDGAPGFLTENTRSFLAPKYTYYASSLDTMNPPSVPAPPHPVHMYAPSPPPPGPMWDDEYNDFLERTHTAKHRAQDNKGNPKAPRGTPPTTAPPRSMETRSMSQHTGIQANQGPLDVRVSLRMSKDGKLIMGRPSSEVVDSAKSMARIPGKVVRHYADVKGKKYQ